MSCHVLSSHIMSYRVFSYHILSCYIMSCYVISCRVMLYHVVLCCVMSCYVVLYRVMLCYIVLSIRNKYRDSDYKDVPSSGVMGSARSSGQSGNINNTSLTNPFNTFYQSILSTHAHSTNPLIPPLSCEITFCSPLVSLLFTFYFPPINHLFC